MIILNDSLLYTEYSPEFPTNTKQQLNFDTLQTNFSSEQFSFTTPEVNVYGWIYKMPYTRYTTRFLSS